MVRWEWVARGYRFGWVVAFLAVCSVAAWAQGTPEARHAASLVDVNSYHGFLYDELYTHNGDDRGYGPEHNLARDNIYAWFQSYGLTTSYHYFTYWFSTYRNVVAELPGTTRPDQIYIVGAHYDSVDNPGADDDASGVAALLEIARLVSQWESEATIRFIAFDREEQGLIGSDAYATDYQNDDIRGMVQLDMISYRGSAGNKARVYGRTASNPLKNAVRDALSNYAGITVTVGGEMDASDHAPFEWQGFQALVLIEYAWDSNPHYHESTDSVDTVNYVNYTYAADNTRGVMGWLVDAAGITPPLPVGDMNGDYLVNAGDIPAFVMALTDRTAYEALYPDIDPDEVGDCNGDGVFNSGDIPGFVDLLT